MKKLFTILLFLFIFVLTSCSCKLYKERTVDKVFKYDYGYKYRIFLSTGEVLFTNMKYEIGDTVSITVKSGK